MHTPKIVMVGFAAGLALASTLHAQTPVEKPKADPPKAPGAVFSETEKSAIDLLSVMAQRDAVAKDLGQCTAQLTTLQAQQREAQLRDRIAALRQSIEKTHPGYQWDIEKGALVPIPPKAASATP